MTAGPSLAPPTTGRTPTLDLDILFICPSCKHTARPVDDTTDAIECSDPEFCGWAGTAADAELTEI